VSNDINIREYQQVVYIYWLGRELGTVKIGHTNNPSRRLAEFTRETGTPGHQASFAAVVWLDRRREDVEQAVHRKLAKLRRDGEWFEATPEQALAAIIAEVEERNIRYEIEDFADITGAIARAKEEAAARAAEEELAHKRQLETLEAEHLIHAAKYHAEQAETKRLQAEVELAITEGKVKANIESEKAAAIQEQVEIAKAAKEARAVTALVIIAVSIVIAATFVHLFTSPEVDAALVARNLATCNAQLEEANKTIDKFDDQVIAKSGL
jgi:hypothetical protein